MQSHGLDSWLYNKLTRGDVDGADLQEDSLINPSAAILGCGNVAQFHLL